MAEVVLPQPGGPSKRTHFGLFVSFFILVVIKVFFQLLSHDALVIEMACF